GHAGTLDPLATGVLVVAVGSGTRLIEAVQAQAKVYRTVVRLGARSDTLDADGTIEENPNPRQPTEEAIRAALSAQSGTIEQIPPAYSALKVQGKRAYDLARAGQTVALEPRTVRIDRIDIRNYEWPLVELEVACGAGTYIRSIARDLGESLGCGGLVQVLTRTRIGRFRIEDAVDPDRLSSENILTHLQPLSEAVTDWPRANLDDDQTRLIRQGRSLDASRVHWLSERPSEASDVALFDPSGALLALARFDPSSGSLAPRRVLGGGK
ncbi:MAG TPA: tRNA pseudouridine(55) synthase TruB, partial [Isosphaeraceae bacterium]|nr:tRNA pseudouridine(55) synthase TruB [Isosphaeraceae bacterium]